MISLGWLSDLHLDCLYPGDDEMFFLKLSHMKEMDYLVITGDITRGTKIKNHLTMMAKAVDIPIHFVLGNHDYYGLNFEIVDRKVEKIVGVHPSLNWLSIDGPLPIGNKTYLVGSDGWADGRSGDYYGSRVVLNDYRLIEDLTGLEYDPAREIMWQRSHKSICEITKQVEQCALNAERIIVATHVPPFKDSAWHEHRNSDDEWAPFFVNTSLGDALLNLAKKYSDIQFTVLCGHTHGKGIYMASNNLCVYTASAVYEKPELYQVIKIADEPLRV